MNFKQVQEALAEADTFERQYEIVVEALHGHVVEIGDWSPMVEAGIAGAAIKSLAKLQPPDHAWPVRDTCKMLEQIV